MCWLGWKQSKKGAARGLSLGADKVEPTLVASFKVSWDTPLFNNRFSPAGLSVPRSIRKIRTFTRNGVHPPHLQNQKRIRRFLARPATIPRASCGNGAKANSYLSKPHCEEGVHFAFFPNRVRY